MTLADTSPDRSRIAAIGLNATLDYADLARPDVAPTARDLARWVRRWFLRAEPLGVNGAVKRRLYVRRHKMWEYARGLAHTRASRPTRAGAAPMSVLDVGGAMTLPVFYLAESGHRVVCLDIDQRLTAMTNEVARRRALPVDARTTNLAVEEVGAPALGAPGGFDRVYSFCVLEHIPGEGQRAVARRMGELLKPGGMMCLTFDFGEDAPTEQPLHTIEHVRALREAVGLPLMGGEFTDNALRFALDRRRPKARYTFGSLFFVKGEGTPVS